MRTVERTFRGTHREHCVYLPHEATEAGIEWIPWRQATEAGQWVISDDGWVAEVLDVMGPYSGNYQIILPYCRCFISEHQQISFEAMYESGNYTTATPDNWVESELKRKRGERVVRTYASLLIAKGRLEDKDYDVLGRIYRPDQAIPRATLKRLLKQKETKQMIREEIVKLLAEQDITPKTVVEMYNETYQQAREAGQHGVAKSVVDKFHDMLDMSPTKAPEEDPRLGEGSELMGFLEMERTEAVPADDDHLLEEGDQ